MNELNQAIAALQNYDRGSGRALLLPLDQAVAASLGDKPARTKLERQLAGALKTGGSVVAREYLCSKLALIGSDLCVPALASLLADPALATPARNALEAIPSRAATDALRGKLRELPGLQKIGVIHSLGACRDIRSVRALTALLDQPDLDLAAAAAAALGDIASTKAARALRAFLSKSPEVLWQKVSDAMLACAERLIAAGGVSDATTLYQALLMPTLPSQIRAAAARGLSLTERRPPHTR